MKMYAVMKGEEGDYLKQENIIAIYPNFQDACCEAEIADEWYFVEVQVDIDNIFTDKLEHYAEREEETRNLAKLAGG